MSAPPKVPVVITITITETPEGKLGIQCSIPDGASGTVALTVASQALEFIQLMMREVGISKTDQHEGRLQ